MKSLKKDNKYYGSEQKYFGFVIPKDGSNTKTLKPNVEEHHRRYLVHYRGVGKIRRECGIKYLNSLLRSSILFAAKTMYNVNETECRQLERIAEDIFRKSLKTKRVCPIFQLYLETGN